jgi:methyl-accepting chemotaxis protein
MFKNMKLGTKLLLSFLSVAMITLLLGILGYYGAVKSGASIDEIGVVRLPSVDSMLEINRCAEKIGACVRTLAIPGLSKEVRQQQYDDLVQARTDYQKAWDIYEPLPQTTEEAQYWSQFVPAWDAWRTENNKAMDLCRKFDELNIQNPDALEKELETFRGDHYALRGKVLTLLQDQKAFAGGEDHAACAFGQWMSSLTIDNPD